MPVVIIDYKNKNNNNDNNIITVEVLKQANYPERILKLLETPESNNLKTDQPAGDQRQVKIKLVPTKCI